MKNTTLTLTIVLFGMFCSAQITNKTFKTLPKNIKILTIKNKLSAAENFNLVINTLLDNNYEIDKHDQQLLTISTAFTALPKTGTYQLKFRCKNNSVIVSGNFKTGVSTELYGVRSEDNIMSIEKTGAFKSPWGYSFCEMYNFAGKLGEISF